MWKLKKYAYVIVESGRIWQLVIYDWLYDIGIHQVSGLPQLFVQRNRSGRIQLALCKVADDILVTGSRKTIERFCDAISK